jgi:hypothetical protein
MQPSAVFLSRVPGERSLLVGVKENGIWHNDSYCTIILNLFQVSDRMKKYLESIP